MRWLWCNHGITMGFKTMDRHYAHYDTLARAIFVRATWIERYILHIFRISLLHAELIITSVES